MDAAHRVSQRRALLRADGRDRQRERFGRDVSATTRPAAGATSGDTHRTPDYFIQAYHLSDKQTGKEGPWLGGITLDPSVVYEAWCSQRPGGIIVMTEEVHGKPVKAGQSFSAAHIVGYYDNIEAMHQANDRYKGHTTVAADETGWRLGK